jgi:hypothetical protein
MKHWKKEDYIAVAIFIVWFTGIGFISCKFG